MTLHAPPRDVQHPQPIDSVLERVARVKQRGPSRWDGSCPTANHPYGDRSRGLSITTGADDKVLLYCHAGCSSEEIIAALGLEWTHLFPPRQGLPPRPRPRARPYRIPKKLSRAMHSAPEFSLNWTLAKLLAYRHPIGAQRDLLLSWDWLERRGFDVPVAWDLCKLLRGEAFLRYGDAKRAENPHEYARCVARLVEEIET